MDLGSKSTQEHAAPHFALAVMLGSRWGIDHVVKIDDEMTPTKVVMTNCRLEIDESEVFLTILPSAPLPKPENQMASSSPIDSCSTRTRC